MALSCAFFGHSSASDKTLPALEACVERLILEKQVRTFLVGGYGNFDWLAEDAVRKLKVRYPEIELLLVLAYLTGISRNDLKRYDGSIYPEGLEYVPQKFAIARRNRMMVDMADYVIGYINHSWGGAAKAWAYAKRHKEADRLYNVISYE